MNYSDCYCGNYGPDDFGRAGLGAPQRARELLNRHPHFCGRADRFKFENVDGILVVKGTVPTYYLKQLLQSALRKLDGLRIDVRVDVVRSEIDAGMYR
jgi:hypothetical protein